jgi:NAD(P)-dependent dehydrogenase (short-subunit alcohol dehydrogenase family)
VLGPSAERGLPAATIERLLDNHLTPRLGQPEDIAAVIAFLCSDEASFVTGQLVRADGGALSHLPTFARQWRAAQTPVQAPSQEPETPVTPARMIAPRTPSASRPESAGGSGAIVTGGGAGIGRATSLMLAAAGYRVVVADVNSDAAEQVAAEIIESGGSARAVETDVSVEDDVQRMVAATLDFAGRLDVLVNNAAMMGVGPFGPDSDLLTMTSARWDHAFAITLRGQMLACKHALTPMLAQGSGSIVNVSSASALRGDLVRIAYGTAKAGVNSLTRHVATRYGKQGIRCNAVAPGLVRTAGASRMSPEALALYESVHATPYLGEPEDVAAVIAFLASDAARFVTGQILGVDGGELSHMLASLVRTKPSLA